MLSSYIDSIPTEEDRVLFQEANAAATAGAFRAAYVMVWIACAESLKRRFRELSGRDAIATKIFGNIESKEREHRSIDSYLIGQAAEYGFISDTERTELEHVYSMRCIFGHPYETGPSEEQLIAAVDSAVRAVVSKPTFLRHRYVESQIELLAADESYVDDTWAAVKEFADEFLIRIDPSIYGWTIAKLCAKCEALATDPGAAPLFRRLIRFAQAIAMQMPQDVLDGVDARKLLVDHPVSVPRAFSHTKLYPRFPEAVQDIIVGRLLERGSAHPSDLRHVEKLADQSVLTDRQHDRFDSAMAGMSISSIKRSKISPFYVKSQIVEALASHDWYRQNPAADYLWNSGPEGMADMEDSDCEELGRNILQAAEGGSGSACTFMDNLSTDERGWPTPFIRGLVLECFVNEDLQLRMKNEYMRQALRAIDRVDADVRGEVLQMTVESIGRSTPKGFRYTRNSRDAACESIRDTELEDLADELEALAAALESIEIEED